MKLPPIAQDVALLIARVGVGIVFVAHGWQKFQTNGLDATAQAFQGMGVPSPTISAYFATFAELIAGAALILGVLTPIAAVLLALDMAGAFLFVHMSNGVFASDGGWELVVTLGLTAIIIGAVGAGRFSLDRAIIRTPARESVPA
ncbi:DoxX family protein [Kribbella sp. NPDC056951]|uniref:DoxX family protein n=1 Tax=Kribbella sp. NPDC056951 TaxID=3345978 RepID=UPI00362CC8EC